MKKMIMGGITAVWVVILCQARSEHWSDLDTVIDQLRVSVRKGEMTKLDMRLKVEALARKHKELVDANFDPDNPSEISVPDYNRCLSALLALNEMGDKQSLPTLEEISQSKHVLVRTHAISTYIKVAGPVDTLPFIDRIDTRTSPSRYKGFDQFVAYRALEDLVCEEKIPPEFASYAAPRPPLPVLSRAEQEKVHSFMLEKTQANMRNNMASGILDRILSEQLPGYTTSVQRLAMAERLTRSGSEDIRKYGQSIKTEIEKTPVNERKDFRAKGELLDPEKKGD